MKTRRVSQSLAALFLAMIVEWEGRVTRAVADSPQVSVATMNRPELHPRLQTNYGKIPLYFEANQGQADATVKFLARGSGYALALTAQEAVLTLQGTSNGEQGTATSRQARSLATLRMQFVGANTSPAITGLAELPGKTNYFVGKDTTQWRTNISTYAKVKYEQVYPGIDLVYYGNQQQLEYDFIVQPGADPKTIRLAFAGTPGPAPLQIDEAGDLVLPTVAGDVRFHRPHLYQEIDGVKKEIEGQYVMVDSEEEEGTSLQSPASSRQIGFAVAAYDTTKPLIIDPVLGYSVFVAGEGSEGSKIAVDSSGNVYVSSSTVSTGLPSETSGRPFAGAIDVFITKLDPTGTTLLYATYLGGNNGDEGRGIAVDNEGNAYVTGSTSSRDFPTTPGAFSRNCVDSDLQRCELNVFVTKLNAAGSTLTYSTYLGGSRSDVGTDIAVDKFGQASITGYTESPDFPTLHPFQAWNGDTPCGVTGDLCLGVDAFVAKLNATGTALVYSSYLGGNDRDEANSIAVDSSGNAYVTGFTWSADFLTVNPLQSQFGGPGGNLGDAFVTKVSTAGTVTYSTYLGGESQDIGNGIAVDTAGNVYVTGLTDSSDFPTANPLQANLRVSDAFVTEISSSGSALVYSTFLGGSGGDGGSDIAVDAAGNISVVGATYSADFPLLHPFQAGYSGRLCAFGPCSDGFVTKLHNAGNALLYSTYLGGTAPLTFETVSSVAVDQFGNTYIGGSSAAGDFPAENPFHVARTSSSSSLGDHFVAKIGNLPLDPIVAYFESPENGPVAGIAVLRGWAFATEPGVKIQTIELFIDGRRAAEIPGVGLGAIPCCSERQDVQDTFPQYPAENTRNSGWGATVNWNWLNTGPHNVRVWIRSTNGALFITDARTVRAVTPGDYEFLDRFALSQATALIQNQDLVVNSVVVRDKTTQQQKTLNTRFRWFTSTQSLGLVQAETAGISSAQWMAPPFSAWFASLASRVPGWPLLASAQAASALMPYVEDPAPEQIVSGIRIIRGWAFSEEANARISTIHLTTDMDSQGTIPCCSGRGDVAAAFSGQPNALNSGWGATFNYGNLTSGPHTVGVHIEDSTGAAVSLAHNVTVMRLGGYAFVDQFDLSNATARLEGEEIILNGVVVRDKASQQTKTIAVRLRWAQSSQGLEVVAARDL